MDKKACIVCHVIKDAEEYYAHPQMADGHLGICKECHKTRMNKRREDKLEEIHEYDRQRGLLPARKARVRANYGRWPRDHKAERARYLDKYAARVKFTVAIRAGKIPGPPLACQRCFLEKPLEGHHEDYSKPLEVIWLCTFCHGLRHRELNAERRKAKKEAAE